MLIKLGLDGTALLMGWVISFALRFPDQPITQVLSPVWPYLPLWILIQIGYFALFRQYSTIWRYSSLKDLEGLFKAIVMGIITITVVGYFIMPITLPRSVTIMVAMWSLILSGGVRILSRRLLASRVNTKKNGSQVQKVLIYGAGQAGDLLLRDILQSPHIGWEVVGFIDDDPVKKGKYLHSKPIFGGRFHLAEVVNFTKAQIVLFAIPSLSGKEMRELIGFIREQVGDKVEVRIIPGISDVAEGKISVNSVRKVEISDLLRRRPIKLNPEPVKKLLEGKRAIVVGGGGSIGSELCMQIAQYGPEMLALMDCSEYNVYRMERELKDAFPSLNLQCVVGDAKDFHLLHQVFSDVVPHIVFNAAAYKHVPLVELNPWSAVMNNVQIVLNLKQLCRIFAVSRHILISTDKAVRPSSVMGASKRIGELLMVSGDQDASTLNITVRFGNVLGSSGSVINLFQEQISNGGPVTVTHPEMKRYFMLTSEAVELVLQAAAIGKNRDIFVLDMGEPILIKDLAYQMIQLSGLKPELDIKLTYIGLRPGEKLSETLYYEGEETATEIPNLLILRNRVKVGDDFEGRVGQLLSRLYTLNSKDLKLALKELAPEYEPDLNMGDSETALRYPVKTSASLTQLRS